MVRIIIESENVNFQVFTSKANFGVYSRFLLQQITFGLLKCVGEIHNNKD